MKRRDFIKSSVVAGAAIAGAGLHAEEKQDSALKTSPGVLPKRAFGNTGIDLSVIGFGGIVVNGHSPEEISRFVAESIERGVNYFDTAPGYGASEGLMGPAIEPYRDQIFLATKTQERGRDATEILFEQSLERLRTDHIDLYQLHAISDVENDVEAAFSKGGAMEFIEERKKAGQIRFVGFSAHSIDAAKRAFELYDFDSVLFPVNFASHYKNGWGPEIMEIAQSKGVARLALKAMAMQKWQPEDPRRDQYRKAWYEPITDREQAALGVRWTLSQPVTAAIPPGISDLYFMALDIAQEATELTDEERIKVAAWAEEQDALFPTA